MAEQANNNEYRAEENAAALHYAIITLLFATADARFAVSSIDATAITPPSLTPQL